MKVERILIPQPPAFEEHSLERLIARHQGTEHADAVTFDHREERRQQPNDHREKSPKEKDSPDKDVPRDHQPLDLVV